MYYFDGRHKTEVLGVREINNKNFNPVCRHLLDKKNTIQVLIHYLGDTAWVNIPRDWLCADHEYKLDQNGWLVCRNGQCGAKTNPDMAGIANVLCWNCNQPLSVVREFQVV